MTRAVAITNEPNRAVWLKQDPDLERGPVSGFVFSSLDARQVPTHLHRRAQLIHVVRGVSVVTCDQTSWTLPPQRAIWIPSGTPHSVRYPQTSEMRSLFFDTSRLGDGAPGTVQVYQLDNLSRALLCEAAELDWGGEPCRVEQLMLDLLFARLNGCSDVGHVLPGARDPRLHRVMDYLRDRPGDNSTLDELAGIGACSRRTLARLFNEETGMSPALWRRQMRMGLALEMLAAGNPITKIAWDLGYSTTGNFTVAFKATFGTKPSKYFQ